MIMPDVTVVATGFCVGWGLLPRGSALVAVLAGALAAGGVLEGGTLASAGVGGGCWTSLIARARWN